jgi:hypothetical protein
MLADSGKSQNASTLGRKGATWEVQLIYAVEKKRRSGMSSLVLRTAAKFGPKGSDV